MGTIADKTVYLDGTKDAIHDAIVAKGVNIDSGATFRSYATSIAAITTGCAVLPDLVAGGAYPKQDGSPVVITPISGETTAIRLLVAATGPMRTALVLTFTGSPVIDWGDGTTTSPTSGTAAVHTYDGVNPIPCARPWGVYYITVTGGTVTTIASSNDPALWGTLTGNIISVAIKSPSVASIYNLLVSGTISTRPFSAMAEVIFCDCPLVGSGYNMSGPSALFSLILKNTGLLSLSGIPGVPSRIDAFDASSVRINGDFNAEYYFANAASIIFNPENTELGNINLRKNNLSTAAFVALFNSLPTVTSKTLQIGGSAAALALSAAQLEIATNKGWTVTRTY